MLIQHSPVTQRAIRHSYKPVTAYSPKSFPQQPGVQFGVMNRLPGWVTLPLIAALPFIVIGYPIYKPLQLLNDVQKMKLKNKAFAAMGDEAKRYEHLKGIIGDHYAKSVDMKWAASTIGKLKDDTRKTELILKGLGAMRGDYYSRIRKNVLNRLGQSAATLQNPASRDQLLQMIDIRKNYAKKSSFEIEKNNQAIEDLLKQVTSADIPSQQ